MEAGIKIGDMRLSNPIGRMWTLLRWDGEFWRMVNFSAHSRDEVLRLAVSSGVYDRIVGGKDFTAWDIAGVKYQNHASDRTIYTVRDDKAVVAIDDATCHSFPWPGVGVPSIGKGD